MKDTVELVEKKVKILIKLRGYKRRGKRKDYKNAYGIFVKTAAGKAIIYCVPSQKTIGVAFVNQLMKVMEEEKLEIGMIVVSGRYTQAAKKKAPINGIELIPQNFPVFNLFQHELVPKHEILPADEREKLLAKYHATAYQFPRIRTSDPAVKAIGAKVGDIVKVIRDSQTAGETVAYRYVVDG